MTKTESKLEGEGEKEPKGMASLNSSTHVHAGSEGSFSRRKVDPRSPGGAARQERSRAAVVARAVRGGRVHRQLAGGTVEAARTTRCRATVVLRAVCGGCGHRRLARRDGGVVRPSSRGQFAAAAVTVGLPEAARTTGCGSFVRKDWQVSGVCAD